MSYKKLVTRLYLHFPHCALNLLHGLSATAFIWEVFFPFLLSFSARWEILWLPSHLLISLHSARL